MALIKADRVKETSTSTGTGTIALAGAATGYRAFSAVCAVGDTLYYAIAHQTVGEWEVGLATYSAANTLTRTTVHASSNSNLAVTFSAGTKDVFLSVTKAWLDTFITQTSGATNYVVKATGTGTIGDSQIYDNSTNVGIGTASPSVKLDVAGAIKTTGTGFGGASAPTVSMTNSTATTGRSWAINSADNGLFQIFDITAGNATRMAINSSGNVGIGDYSPSAQLHVATTASATKGLIVKGASAQSANLQEWQNANSVARMYVTGDSTAPRLTFLSSADGLLQIYARSTGGNALNIDTGALYVSGSVISSGDIYGTAIRDSGTTLKIAFNPNYLYGQWYIGEGVSASTVPFYIKGASGQSANLQEWQDNNGNVVAAVYSNGGAVFGAQTGAQTSSVIRAWCTPSSTLNGQILTSLTGATGANERYRMSIGNTSSYGFLQTYENAIGYTMNLALQPSGGNVAIGTTSPDSKLHLQDGNLTIKGTANQFIQLWNNSTVAANIGGNINFRGTYRNSDLDSVTYAQIFGGKENATNGDYAGYISFSTYPFPGSLTERMRITSTGNVGIGTTSPAGQLHTQATASGTKALVVRGASGQSANLQEWQNNSGTALAYINSSGILVVPEIYAPIITDVGGVGYYKQYFITRTLPDTVGDYVEFLEYAHTVGTRFKIDVMAADYPYWDSATYEFNSIWDNGSYIMPPKFRYHRNTSDLVLEKVHGQSNPYASRLRLRRIGAKSHTGSTTVRIRVEVWATSIAGFPTDASATGTSTLSSYGSDQSFCNPILQVPPQLFSGSGSSLSLYAGSASGTGNGGDIILQSGSLATSGVGGGVALRPTPSSAGQYSSSVSLGYLNRYTPCHYTFERMLPNTVGDYVELFSFNAADSSWVEFDVLIWKHAEAYGSKSYKISGSYMQSSGLIQPVGNGIENHGYAGFFNNIFEVELAYPDVSPGTIRLRRTAAGGTNVYAYVYVRAQTLGLIEKSGTGTSSFGLTNPNSTHLTFPTLITPMPVPGGNGSGFSMTLKARDAAGTGDGGSILLQAGAYATSGSNGKVIVRGLASNTANLQEWQNNAGSLLSAVNSAGDFTNTGGYSYTEKFGNAASVSSSYATAIGYGTTAGQLSTAVGAFAVASGVTSTAFGADANAAGSGGTALGRSANAAAGAVAVGFSASASGNNGIAVGRSAIAGTGTAIGYNFTGSGVGYTSFCASTDGRFSTGAIDVFAGDGVNANTNISRQHSILGTWATATYASRLGRVQLRVNDYTTDREAIRYESDGANALTSIGGAAVIASTTLAVQPAVSGNKGIVVKAASGQSANLQEWQNNAGTALAYVDSSGRAMLGGSNPVYFGNYGSGQSEIYVTSQLYLRVPYITHYGAAPYMQWDDVGVVPIVIRSRPSVGSSFITITGNSNSSDRTYIRLQATASQTVNLQEWQNSSGVNIASIGASGALFTQGNYTFGTAGEAAGGPFTIAVAASGSSTVATKGQRYGRNLVIKAGDSDNYAGVAGGDTYLRAGAPVSPATTYGTIYIGDTGGYTSISGMVQPSSTPAALTADQNNLVLSASGFQRLSGTAARTITGIAPPSGASHVDGRMMRIYNVGSYNITLKHNSTSSSIANRFCCVQAIDIVLGPRDFAELIYDGTDGGLVSGQNNPCWRVA